MRWTEKLKFRSRPSQKSLRWNIYPWLLTWARGARAHQKGHSPCQGAGQRDHPPEKQETSHPLKPHCSTMAGPAALEPAQTAEGKAALPRDTCWKSCSVFPSRPGGRLQLRIRVQFVKKSRIKYGVKMENMLDDIAYECQLCLRVFTGRLQPAILIGSQSRKWKCFTKQDEWMTFVLQIGDDYLWRWINSKVKMKFQFPQARGKHKYKTLSQFSKLFHKSRGERIQMCRLRKHKCSCWPHLTFRISAAPWLKKLPTRFTKPLPPASPKSGRLLVKLQQDLTKTWKVACRREKIEVDLDVI